jgi:hypothetical protein
MLVFFIPVLWKVPQKDPIIFLVLDVLLKMPFKSALTMLSLVFAADILSLTILILSLISHSMFNQAQMQCFIHILNMRMIFVALECLSLPEL